MIVSKDICLGLLATLLAKPDTCIDHFLKAIIDCHVFGNPKLVRHLVRLLFPFGLESWYMIKGLAQLEIKSRSRMTDQYFCNVMAFYYRAMLSEYLADEKLKRKSGLVASAQNGVANDVGECSSRSTAESEDSPLIAHDNIATNERSFATSNVFSEVLVNLDSCVADEKQPKIASSKLRETSIRDVYRIALVCSTILLSDIYAKFQRANDNIKHCLAGKVKRSQDGVRSEVEAELEVSLSVSKKKNSFLIGICFEGRPFCFSGFAS